MTGGQERRRRAPTLLFARRSAFSRRVEFGPALGLIHGRLELPWRSPRSPAPDGWDRRLRLQLRVLAKWWRPRPRRAGRRTCDRPDHGGDDDGVRSAVLLEQQARRVDVRSACSGSAAREAAALVVGAWDRTDRSKLRVPVNRIGVRASQCLGVLVLAVVVFQASAQPAPSLPDQRAADLAALDRFVRDSYAFLPTKATDWNRVISSLMPRARAARDDTTWLHVLEEALDALYDGHTQLNTNAPDSWRPVPYGLWVQPNNGRYIVTAVPAGCAAGTHGRSA